MVSKKTQILRGLLGFALATVLAVGCSSSEPAQSPATTPDSTQAASNDNGEPESGSEGSETVDGDTPLQGDEGDVVEATPQPLMGPTLSDENLASVQDLGAGEQVEDAHGNLIAIYGIAVWPEPFAMLSDTTRTEFPFFSDVQMVADPSSQLVVLDVGMCAAGLDVSGFGTAEFFVHESFTEALSTDPMVGREVLARHPVARPGFGFPSAAECERGFLPVLWNIDRTPAVARYVLATRASAGAEVEQHVYQWDLESVIVEGSDEGDEIEPQFAIGQTVTFNQGVLQDTTVVVDGWAELIGTESPIDGTRMVAVSLDYCSSSTRPPELGLGVDNWNIVAPIDDAGLLASEPEDPESTCFGGWLEFAIPFGSVPTAFFASDGVDKTVGYAEWSLLDAALPAPQS